MIYNLLMLVVIHSLYQIMEELLVVVQLENKGIKIKVYNSYFNHIVKAIPLGPP